MAQSPAVVSKRARTVADRIARARALRQFAETAARTALNDELARMRDLATSLVSSGDITYDIDGDVNNPVLTVSADGDKRLKAEVRRIRATMGNHAIEALRRMLVEELETAARR